MGSDATASVARQRMARARMEESSARGGWGDASVDTAAGADDDGLYGGIPGGPTHTYYIHTYIVTIPLIPLLINAHDCVFSEYVIHRLDDAVVEYGKQFDSLMTLLKEQVRSLEIVDSFAIELVVAVVIVAACL